MRGRGRRLGGELRASRVFLTEEFSHARWLDLGRFRWRDLALGRAVRTAFGVISPLALGIATGHAEYGTYAALGALPAGFVSFRGITRTRVLAVLIAAAGMAVSTFVGATTAASAPWLLVPVLMIWAYAVGICAALGPTATAVSLQGPLALLIASAVPLGPAPAAVRAALVLAGGLWQGALVVTSWALSHGSAERTAVAASYRALSNYASELASGHPGPPGPAPLPGADALRDPNPLLRSAARLHLMDLMEEAERIRSTLTALGSFALPQPGERRHEPATSPPAAKFRDLLATSSSVLAEIADALTGRSGSRAGHLRRAPQLIAGMPDQPDAPWHWADQALRGQLRSACRIAGRLNEAEPSVREGGSAGILRRGTVRDLSLTLRASLSPSSEAGRHALRLAITAAAAEVLVRAAGLSHGYWAVLTVFIVLRPDYSSTLYRGLQRAAGTIAGAGLGLATALLAHAGNGLLLTGIAISLVAAYAVFAVNYLLYAVFLTDFVVVLLSLLGLPPEPTALARLAGTGIGTGLAVLAYALWPTWEGSAASEKFARLLLAQGRYAAALLPAYSRPDDESTTRLGGLQLAARRARIEAEASADRLADEPARPPMTAEFGQALTSAVHQLALAALTLDAVVALHHRLMRTAGPGSDQQARRDRVRPEEAPGVQPELDQLADGVSQATGELARSLRRLRPPGLLPRLRQLQAAIVGAAGPESFGLQEATDGLVDAVNTAADVIRAHLAPGSGTGRSGR